MKHWETIESAYLLERPWMNVRTDRVRMADGMVLDEFHVVEYPDWACMLCLTEQGEVLMVEQYRHGVEAVTLELPAGIIEADEDPGAAARRELLEETGYAAEDWTLLGRCAPNPSKSNNFAHLFVARGARRVQNPRLDATEAIQTRLVPPAEVFTLAERGALVHGIHLTVLWWARARGFFGDVL